ncbi:hypothetical protein BASA61_008362 [Batrachochytrium salamandrivorans]|nr:hypothetical protein BASA62_006690 [Batrachochytrium salamandrivorans]KAH6582796.1 hypothetical protein BASA61_008362 [Batrachochytrium salamandrivorans]KAJ1340902.1 hypothetical protein BSLG_004378 [Batrachochytrium salamandrivorans]
MPLLTTDEGIRAWLVSQIPTATVQSITPLRGGTANFVWRAMLAVPQELPLPFGLRRIDTSTMDAQQLQLQSNTQLFTVIVKHAEAFIASSPDVPFDLSRMRYEVNAMHLACGLGVSDPSVSKDHGISHVIPTTQITCPRVLHFDEETYTLIMEDAGVGSMHLKAYMSTDTTTTNRSNINECMLDGTFSRAESPANSVYASIGSGLGSFIGRLHNTGRSMTKQDLHSYSNPHALSMSNYALYARFERALEHHKVDALQRGDSVNAMKWASDILMAGDTHDQASICMGDFWPGNILIHTINPTALHLAPGSDTMPVGSSNICVSVVDWELTRVGPTPMDLAQFLAEAYCIHIYRQPIPNLLDAFQRAYLAVTLPIQPFSAADLQLCCIHIGAHLMLWGPHTGWFDSGDKENTNRLINLGLSLMNAAWRCDWAAVAATEIGSSLQPFIHAVTQL